MAIVWKEFESIASGSTDKFATCEACGTDYAYVMFRTVSGLGVSYYMLDNKGAAQRSREKAQEKLLQALQVGIDPIPCPKCGHFQPDMVGEARRRWLPLLGLHNLLYMLGGWLVIGFALIYLNGMLSDRGAVLPWGYVLPTVAFLGVIILFMPLWRSILSLGHNPNTLSAEARFYKGYVGGVERSQFEAMKTQENANRDEQKPSRRRRK